MLVLVTSILFTIILFYLCSLYKHFRKIAVLTCESTGQKSGCKSLKVYQQAPGPFPWPLLGNLNLLIHYNAPSEAFTDLSKKFGDIYSLTLGSTRCIVINNLELIREVLNQNGKFFGGRPNFLRYHKLFGGNRNNSLALCDWSLLQKKRRNLARRHCSPRETSPYFTKMSRIGCLETNKLLRKLNKEIISGETILIKPFIQQTCANMFFQYMCSVSFKYNDWEFCQVVEFFDEVFWEINQGYALDFLPWLKPLYLTHLNKIKNWSSTIRKFIMKKIVKRREQHLYNESDSDFTDALYKSLLKDKNVSEDTIIFMLEDFIGGHSAVGNLVMITLIYIAQHPNVAKRIQSEVDKLSDNGQRRINLFDIDAMPYTMATIFEVLRCSSSPIVPHVATQDTTISNYGVGKDTIVFINNYKLNHTKLYWKKPHIFQPERFLEEVCIKTGSRTGIFKRRNSVESNSGLDYYTEMSTLSLTLDGSVLSTNSKKIQIRKNIPYFIPFSIGQRTCIGQNLVRGFGFILVANILQQYDINYENTNGIRLTPACMALPAKSTPLVISNRISKYICRGK